MSKEIQTRAIKAQGIAARFHEKTVVARELGLDDSANDAAEDRSWCFLESWWQRFGTAEPEPWA